MKRRLLNLTVALAIGLPSSSLPFGGEDVLNGDPWHHVHITDIALGHGGDHYSGMGFSDAAVDDIKWHADNIDAYLYSPIFWAKGGLSKTRIKASLVGYSELAKLHFDDTFSMDGIRQTWTRYAAGTLIGLYWASEQMVDNRKGDVAAARNILGLSVHAVQDFYSHSNWVDDPDRRCATWFDLPPDERHSLTPIHTGAYETPTQGAPANHGHYSVSCSLISGENVDQVLDVVCAGLSPFQNTGLCEEWRLCYGSERVDIQVADKSPEGIVRLNPPGIALDSSWLARVQALERKLVDDTGTFREGIEGMYFPRDQCSVLMGWPGQRQCETDADYIFAGTKDLAIRGTIEWMQWIEVAVAEMGPEFAAFWEKVKGGGEIAVHEATPVTDVAATIAENVSQDAVARMERLRIEMRRESSRAAQFEDFSKLPYLFLSAGSYPVANAAREGMEESGNPYGWYLRVKLRTGEGFFDDTDSDIFAEVRVGGFWKPFKLDYLPITDTTGRTDNPILAYDDFERGDDDAYVIGPFSSQPDLIRLHNGSTGTRDVLLALVADLGNSIDSSLTSLRRGILSLIAGNADYVGYAHDVITRADIERLLAAQETTAFERKMFVDGGIQGKFRIKYRVRDVEHMLTDQDRAQGMRAVEVMPYSLHSLKESEVDRASDSDEPFVIFSTTPLNAAGAKAHVYMSKIFQDVDQFDTRAFPRETGSAQTFKVAPNGSLVLAVQVYENDDESEYDREQLRLNFATGLDEATREPPAQLLDAIGRATAADWFAQTIEVFAFRRGALPQAGEVLDTVFVGLVPEQSRSSEFKLNWTKVRSLLSAENRIDDYLSDQMSPWVPDPTEITVAANAGDLLTATTEGVSTSLKVFRCNRQYE